MATRNSGMTVVNDVQDDVEKGFVKPTDPAPDVTDFDPNADETSSTTSIGVPETVDGAEAQLKYLGWHDWWKCVKLVLEPWGTWAFVALRGGLDLSLVLQD